MKTEIKPIWYLAGPFYQYNEDVKALAKKAGVVIVDAAVTTDRHNAADPDQLPTVTLKADGPSTGTAAAAILASAAPAVGTVAAGPVDLGNGRTIAAADLETKAIELSGLTSGKFKQLKKAEREGFVIMALESAKAQG